MATKGLAIMSNVCTINDVRALQTENTFPLLHSRTLSDIFKNENN